MVGTQAYLMLSGNYAWLNLVTLVVAVDGGARRFRGLASRRAGGGPLGAPAWFVGLGDRRDRRWWCSSATGPCATCFGRHQLMNFSFNRLHLVNTYGAFGSVTRRRKEVVLEGAEVERPAEADWREYEFYGKPGDPRRRPPQVAPYHLRLDWLMWFVALAPAYGDGWLPPPSPPVAGGRPPHPSPAPPQPLPRRASPMGPCTPLPLPLHDRRRAPGDRRLVGSGAGGNPDGPAGAATRRAGHGQAPNI